MYYYFFNDYDLECLTFFTEFSSVCVGFSYFKRLKVKKIVKLSDRIKLDRSDIYSWLDIAVFSYIHHISHQHLHVQC